MGALLVNVEKSFGGETWVNTHCLRMNGADGPITDSDMTALGVQTLISASNTASGGAVNPLTRILSFERLAHKTPVTITRVYVTDGLRNDLTQPDFFWSSSLSLAGLDPLGTWTVNDLAPGTVSWVINRIPLGYNSRQGRMFIRGYLLDAAVRFNMRGGVDYTDSTTSAQAATALGSMISGSLIAALFNGGTSAGVALYCIPHYISAKSGAPKHQVGQLASTTPVTGFTAGLPRNRQMLKGKKRKAAATTTPTV